MSKLSKEYLPHLIKNLNQVILSPSKEEEPQSNSSCLTYHKVKFFAGYRSL